MAKGKVGESQIWAFLAVFLGIIGFILVLLTQKKDKYAMFYAKQSLVLMIAWVISFVIAIIPVLGWIVSPIIALVIFVLWIIAIINTFSGTEKLTPIIGKFAEKFNF
ncbi:MAG: DUF4870 domain-containing protein [Candidatus Nanoarchaeia archaeon]|nr:DUF4870 domain-containing protein [Candidatus Nanoarchaeia archaeon]MDD5239559.1 DUF4870 domain-containing protein [Candidatus Nanoarchaeia archaeon]